MVQQLDCLVKFSYGYREDNDALLMIGNDGCPTTDQITAAYLHSWVAKGVLCSIANVQ